MRKKRFVEMIKGIDYLAVAIGLIVLVMMLLIFNKIANTSYMATIEQSNGTVKQLEVSTYNIDDGAITLFCSDGERFVVSTEKCSIRRIKK